MTHAIGAHDTDTDFKGWAGVAAASSTTHWAGLPSIFSEVYADNIEIVFISVFFSVFFPFIFDDFDWSYLLLGNIFNIL